MTAIFAKIGIKGVDSDLATLVRTAVIMGGGIGMVAGGVLLLALKR
ncbi:hypothetical protein [uncultured Thiodictyon sp.]|jgi:transporter family protein|nr:hypothetical protein [uncultured Thiodictyon sp.]